jgi:glucose/arabinose dehydrogenase
VYVAYTYGATPGDCNEQDDPRAKVVRYTYDETAQTLGEPKELIAGIPAGNDHNGGRLKIGPDSETIYVATDSSGYGRDAMNGATDQLANPGSILVFKFTGETTDGAAKPQ